MIGRIKCFIIAIIDLIRYRVYSPHFYTQTEEPAIIIATDNSFRVSDNYQHTPNETVYPNSTLLHCKCKYCGHEMLSWIDNNKDMPILKGE